MYVICRRWWVGGVGDGGDVTGAGEGFGGAGSGVGVAAGCFTSKTGGAAEAGGV